MKYAIDYEKYETHWQWSVSVEGDLIAHGTSPTLAGAMDAADAVVEEAESEAQ